MTETYTVGTRVSERVDTDCCFDDIGSERKGMVIAILPEPLSKDANAKKLIVRWDRTTWQPDKVEELHENDLMLEADAEKETNRLLEEWRELRDAVKAKLAVAADAINDAGKLAKEHGRELHDLYDTHYELTRAMDNAGWSTSSWNC